MLAHVTDTGVRYEINVSRDEARRRVAAIIRALYPTFLDLCASARGAEDQSVVGKTTLKQNTQVEARFGVDPRLRSRVHGGRP